jgi:tetratricopeptide (TPR) repeat protein
MIARLATLLVPVLVMAPCGAAAAQDDPLDKYVAYLERDPYHEAVFEQLLHAAVEAGALPRVTSDYTARVAREPADTTARVLLARIYGRVHRGDEALELLGTIEPETAQLAYLRARVHLGRAELEPAAAALERAAALAEERELCASVLTLAGRTWHRLGRDDEARRALRAFAALDPDSFTQRLEAGALLGECGLAAAAVEELTRAAELAAGDAAREVRAWVAVGRQEERRGRGREAEAAYARAAARMGPGHWQRDDVFERRLAIQRSLGALDAWAETCRAAVREARSDVEARAHLARALVAAGRTEDALEVMAEAARDFPDALDVGTERARLLASAGRAREAAEEYQRLAAGHPGEARLHREAGLLHASLGHADIARRQWELELARDPRSVELHLDLARLHARFGLAGRADELLRAAIEMAPGDLRPVRALSARWIADGMGARVVQLLEATEQRAVQRRDAGVLEELAQDWLEREDDTRAQRALEQALAAGGAERRVLTSLAALLEAGRDFERTRAVLTRLLELAQGPRERVELVERIGKHYRRSHRTRRLEQTQRRLLRDSPRALTPSLLLAYALAAQQQFGEAEEVLHELLHVPELAPDAHWALSGLAEVRGDRGAAVAHLRALAEVAPRERRDLLQRVAVLLRRAGDQAGAQAVEEELLALDPTSRSLLTDLAREERRRQNPERAVELLRRALALHPNDEEARLALVDLHARLGQPDLAREELLRVLRSRDPERRAQALDAFNGRALGRLAPELEIAELRRRLAAEPERFELGILLALYAREIFDYEAGVQVLADLRRRFASEPALAEAAALLRGTTLASASAPLDAGELVGDLRVADLLLAQGDPAGARAPLAAHGGPVAAANLCLARGFPAEARRLLEAACRAEPSNAQLWVRLAVAERAAGRDGAAARALKSAVSAAGAPWHLLLLQGELQLERRYNRGARDVGRALFGALARSRALAASDPAGAALHEERVARLVTFYEAGHLERDFLIAGEAALLATPGDPPLLDAVLSRMSRSKSTSARKILAAARAAGGVPEGWTAAAWHGLLALHAERFTPGARHR